MTEQGESRDEDSATPSSRRFEALAEVVTGAVFQLDEDHQFVAVDDEFTARTGYGRAAVLGERPGCVFGDRATDRLEAALARLDDDDGGTLQVPVDTASGSRSTFELRLQGVGGDGSNLGVVGVLEPVAGSESRDLDATPGEETATSGDGTPSDETTDSGDATEVSRRHYETLVENFPNGAVGLVDEDLRYTMVGGTPLTADGQTSLDLAGRRISDVLPEALAADIVPKYRAALAGERERFERPVGDRVVRFQTFPVRDDDGTVIAAMGVSQDVTEQKDRERELSKYKSLVETVNEGIYVVDEDFRYTTVNEAFVELSGYSREELLGAHASIVVDDSTIEEAAAVRATDDAPKSLETTMERADGSEVPVEVTFTDLERDDATTERVGVLRDITERREREQQLSALVDNVPGMVYRCRNEPTWPMEYVSKGCRELTGYDNEALERGEVSFGEDVVVDEDQEDLWVDVQEGLESDGSFLVSYRIETPDGETRWVRERGRGVYDDDGSLTELEGVIIDITERKRLEVELEEILGRVTDAFYALDDEFRFTHVNERAEQLLEASEEELLGESIWKVYPEAAEIDDVWDAFHDAMESQEPQSFELYFDPLDFWVEATVHPSETGVSVYFRDITGRREQRRKVEESERRYRALVENFPEGAVGLYDENLEYTAIGGELVDELDVSMEDRVGRSVYEIYPDELTEEVEPYFEAALDGDASSFEVEYHGRHLSARTLPIRDADGSVSAGMLVVQDVTERTENRRKLEESEQRYRSLVENLPEGGVGVFDEDLEYTFVDGTMWDDIELDAADVEGQTVWEALPESTAADIEPVFRAALDGDTESMESTLGGRTYRMWATPLRDADGEITAGQSIALDVTEQKDRERRLERTLDLLERTERIADVGGWEIDVETMDVFWSDHIFDILGVDADEAPPLDEALDMYHEDDQQAVEDAVDAAIESGEPFDVQVRNRTATGEIRWLRLLGAPETEDGEVVAVRGAAQDITERKEREQFLEDAKAQMEAAAEAGAVGTWEWHVPENRFVADAALAERFGVDPEQAREGIPLERVTAAIHEDDRDRVEAAIEEAVETCGDYEQEYRVYGADDELRWVVARGHVECDADGEPTTFPGALTDITEQKRVEQQVKRQRKQLETLFEVLPVGVVVAEADGELVDANEVARDIWGGDVFDATSVGEYDRYDMWWEDTGERVAPDEVTMAKVLRGEVVQEPDILRIEGDDGTERIIMVHGKPVLDDDGDVDRGVVTFTDITERREYQRKLEESNERLEQFAYAASHDLQEPLRMISSYLSLIEERYEPVLDDDGEEFLEYAVDGADRMQEMIDALLEYSRVQTEGEDFEPVDLDAVFDDVRRDYELRIQETDADVEAESLPTVSGDEDQLRQVFGNLLSNALEYSGDEPPEVTVSAEHAGDEWVVAVRDEGIGIEAEHADRIFEVFQHLHSQDEHSGTGIGLALAQRVVERHGGDIWVESEPGNGSTFYFSIPEGEESDD